MLYRNLLCGGLLIASVTFVLLTACRPGNWPPQRRRAVQPAVQPQAGQAQETPEAPLQLYQLVLLSQPAPAAAPPGMVHVRLAHASARPVGELLQVMILPSGPTGTRDRYTLLYPTRSETELAEQWSRRLDINNINIDYINEAQFELADYQTLIGAYYHIDQISKVEQQNALWEALIAGMDRFSRQGQGEQAWSAAVLAADLSARHFYQYQQADRLLRQGQQKVLAGTYEQMVCWYRRAVYARKDGRVEQARKLLADLIAQFKKYRDTEIYQRADRLLAEL